MSIRILVWLRFPARYATWIGVIYAGRRSQYYRGQSDQAILRGIRTFEPFSQHSVQLAPSDLREREGEVQRNQTYRFRSPGRYCFVARCQSVSWDRSESTQISTRFVCVRSLKSHVMIYLTLWAKSNCNRPIPSGRNALPFPSHLIISTTLHICAPLSHQ